MASCAAVLVVAFLARTASAGMASAARRRMGGDAPGGRAQ